MHPNYPPSALVAGMYSFLVLPACIISLGFALLMLFIAIINLTTTDPDAGDDGERTDDDFYD